LIFILLLLYFQYSYLFHFPTFSDTEQRRDPWQNPPGRTQSQKDISGKTRQTHRPRPDLHQSHRERQAQSFIHDNFENLFKPKKVLITIKIPHTAHDR